jgi:NAD(P)-dependent dehydrogenase (short-subunit alcohol dehydrogenase family)
MQVDRVAAISGAAGSLGPAVVEAFFRAGARLAVAGRDAERLSRLLDSLGVPEEKRLVTAVDLSDPAGAAAWAAAVTGRFGRVDVVLHLVGGYRGGTAIADIPPEDWQFLKTAAMDTTLNVVRAFSRPLRECGRGRFISVTSPKAQAPAAKGAIYAMAKAASDAAVLALADELRGSGATANLISVNAIGPADQGRDYGKSTPPAEIAAAMLYLCSDEAGRINGVRLSLAGRGT